MMPVPNELDQLMPDDGPSNTQKVAILLAALESSLAVNLLQKFDPADVKLILDSSNKLGPLRKQDVEPLVEAFTSEFSAALGISAGSQHLMALLESAFSAEQVASLLGHTPKLEGESVWPKFTLGIETTLVPYLLDEHEQTAAFVISRLTPELTARCLMAFPKSSRSRIVTRLLKMGQVEKSMLDVLESALMADLFSKARKKDDGASRDRFANVINMLDRPQSLELMEELGKTSPEDLKALRKLIFMFEDIVHLDQKHRMKLFDRVPIDQVIPAVFGVDAAFREMVLTSLGARARRMVESELQGDIAQPRNDTLPARRRIGDLAIQMARKGEIELPDLESAAA
jgi:flagellar motor switch protein FliG